MEHVTPEQLMNTVVVVLAIFAAIITVDKVIDIVKKWRAPATDVMSKLSADKIRLDKHDKEIADLTRKVNALCKAEVAHLQHELTGNSVDGLRKAMTELTNALIEH